jgi:hypothetical protein
MVWRKYDNPKGGFWSCPSWKEHKDGGQKYTAIFPTQTAPVAQKPATTQPSALGEALKSIQTGQGIMQEEITAIMNRLGVIEDLVRQLVKTKI